jgi:hydrogenase nickel incorporation protein HypB
MDLAEAVGSDEMAVKANIQAVRPGMHQLFVSSKTGAGLTEYMQFLAARLAECMRKTSA